MATTRRNNRIDALRRRMLHLESRLRDVPDGAGMYDRRERASLRYAIGLVEAAQRLGLLDVLEANAYSAGAISSGDTTATARALVHDDPGLHDWFRPKRSELTRCRKCGVPFAAAAGAQPCQAVA